MIDARFLVLFVAQHEPLIYPGLIEVLHDPARVYAADLGGRNPRASEPLSVLVLEPDGSLAPVAYDFPVASGSAIRSDLRPLGTDMPRSITPHFVGSVAMRSSH